MNLILVVQEVSMSLISYPAIFHKEPQGYWVEFPDLPGCLSQGETVEDSYRNAMEALGLYLDKDSDPIERNIPEPSKIDCIFRDNRNDLVMLVTVDSVGYARKHRTKAVKKTLSIPQWLNDMAIRENVNFSQVLQEALIKKLVG